MLAVGVQVGTGLVALTQRIEISGLECRAQALVEGKRGDFSPGGARSRERSLMEMTDADLQRLFEFSQPSDTSPEADYAK